MTTTILCNLSDAIQCTKEARLQWICNILDSLGVPEEVYTSDMKAYRGKMAEMGIEVELVTNGDVNVYKQTWYTNKDDKDIGGWLPSKKENLVAQWKEPTRVMKIDGLEAYYELHLDEWSMLNTRKING